MKPLTIKFLAVFCLLFGLNLNANAQGFRQQTISQLVKHSPGSEVCETGNYSLYLLVSYSLAGNSYSVLSSPVTDLDPGGSDNLSVSIPNAATVISTSIRVVADNGFTVYDLSSDATEVPHHLPGDEDWLDCIDTDVLLISDPGDLFVFGFTSVL